MSMCNHVFEHKQDLSNPLTMSMHITQCVYVKPMRLIVEGLNVLRHNYLADLHKVTQQKLKILTKMHPDVIRLANVDNLYNKMS